MITGLSLFTGYGGLDLALRDYVKTIGYVEIEQYAQRIISERMAEGALDRAPIYSDVKNIEGEIGLCDIIFGGFPCQDISVAGNGKGLAGERSGLFFEIVRLTKEIQPSFVFLENVPAIRTRGLEQVICEFTKMGYDCRWTMLSAESVGAPHKRERWFFLAHSYSELLRLERERDTQGKTDFKKKSKLNGINWAMADTDGQGLEGFTETERSRSSRRLKAFDSCFSGKKYWAIEPRVGRVANGIAFRVDRIKALGNGVVPLQAKTAFEKLMGLK